MKNLTVLHKTNSLRAVLALTKASIISVISNPTSLFFTFFFPFVFITIFGLLGNDVSFKIGIKKDSLKEGPVYEAIKNTKVLNLQPNYSDKQLEEKLKTGQIPVVIDIQKTDLKKFTSDKNSVLQIPSYTIAIQKSASDPSNANTVLSILNSIISQVNSSANTNKQKNEIIQTNISEVKGRKLKQIDFILPGQLAFSLLSNSLFGVSMLFISMRKNLIIKRIFASPIKKWTIIVSEALSRTIIGVLQALVIISVGYLVFGFTLANGFLTLIYMIILSILGVFTFLGFGFLVASLGNSEDTVAPIANLIMMPQLFLSGAFFSIELFPKIVQPLAQKLPLTFLNEAFRKVAFEGQDITKTLPQLLGLFIWAVIIYAIAIKLFRWE